MPSGGETKEEENSLLQSEQEQSLKHKIHQVVLKTQSHNHRGNDRVGGDKKTLQAFLKSEFTLQITFTEYCIYIYCIYIYIHTEKIFPKEKIRIR